MKQKEFLGAIIIVALIALPSLMAFKTMPPRQLVMAGLCLNQSVVRFKVSWKEIIRMDVMQYGVVLVGDPCKRFPGEAKAISEANETYSKAYGRAKREGEMPHENQTN